MYIVCRDAIVYMLMKVSYIPYLWISACLVFIVFECLDTYLFLAGEKDGCFLYLYPVLCGCPLIGVSWILSEDGDH